MKIPWLEPDDPLPPPERALRRPNGLLAAGGGLSMTRLVDAYSRGCFPWFNPGETDPVVDAGPAHGAWCPTSCTCRGR